jgi:universal stress protein E
VAEAVLGHSTVPVLAVRPGEPELTFRKVLCAVDMSPVSATAVRQAARLARAFGARLVLVSVVPKAGWLSAVAGTGKLVGAVAEHERNWREEFAQFVEGLDLVGVSWEEEVRHGQPAEQIAAAMREHGADLLVMGSTGRSGLARVLLGSTTRRVLRQLPCSLLAVNREAAEDEHVGYTSFLMAEGRRLLSAGCYSSALLKFREVLAFTPFHAPAWEGQAQALGELGKHEEADRCLEHARLIRGESG